MYYYDDAFGAQGAGFADYIGTHVGRFTSEGLTTIGISASTRSVGPGPSNETLTSADFTLFCSCTLGNIIVNLPSALGIFTGRIYNVKKTDATAFTVTVTPFPPETIDAAATKVISVQYISLQFQSDGSNWHII